MAHCKEDVRLALERNDLDALAGMALRNRRVVNVLVRIAYDKETLAGQRAIRVMGLVAKELVKTDPAFLRDTIRKLLWSLNDESGGIGWSAPELLGEIVSADPARFSDIIPLIAEAYDVEEETFRPGVLYALGRIAEASPERVMPHLDLVERGLRDRNPMARVYAIDAVERLWGGMNVSDREKLGNAVKELRQDVNEVWRYRDSDFEGITVGEKAGEVINRLNMF